MEKRTVFSLSRWPLRWKLFLHILLLAALLALTLLMGLVLFGQYETTEEKTFRTLDMQMEVFEKDMETHLDHLAASGIELSEELGVLLDDYLTRQNLAFPALSDDTERIEAVQMLFSQPLTELLLQEDCSGVFILLDVTVNSRLKDADFSRSGLYLQVNGYDKDMPQNRDVVLYRRRSGKYVLHRIMVVRKQDYVLCGDNCWNLEPGIRDEQILGVLTAVIRDGKRLDVKAPGYRARVFIWWLLYPIRACVIYIRFLVGKLWAKIKSTAA